MGELPNPSVDKTKFHVGLNVSDLEKSVRFYQSLLGTPPTKHYADYSRFELSTPPLVLALYPSPQKPGGSLNHVGFRFPDSHALVAVQRRLEENGIPTQRQEGVECCYSRQTKFWVVDPDKVLWEIYTLHEDIEHSGFDAPLAANPPNEISEWRHRLNETFPNNIPHSSGSLDAIMLEGTFNGGLTKEQLLGLAREAFRVLKPGGYISVHGLVSDKPFPGEPKLPGLASLVRNVPIETEPMETLIQAGFAAIDLEKLGDIHCFGISGLEMRELRVKGWKPKSAGASKSKVVYKGPFEEIVTEDGTPLKRGAIYELDPEIASSLVCGPVADHFSFIGSV